MKLLHGHDDTVAEWVEGKMGGRCVFPHRALGIIDDRGTLRGGFVLCFHNPSTAELTVYAPDALTHGTVRGFFVWAFEDFRVWRLQLSTTKSNRTVKRGAPKMGFRFEGVAKDYYGRGVDALRYGMTADRCRWINGRTFQQAGRA